MLFLVYCLALVAIAVGFSLASSVLFLRYRDLNQIWDVAIQAGFFLAPVIYPLGIIPERFHIYLYLWPPTPVIEFSRAVLVNGAIPTRSHMSAWPQTSSRACSLASSSFAGLRLTPRSICDDDAASHRRGLGVEDVPDSERAPPDGARAPVRTAGSRDNFRTCVSWIRSASMSGAARRWASWAGTVPEKARC